MKPNRTSRKMTSEQRAEISASKRFDRDKQAEQWLSWYEWYLNDFLPQQALPAAKIGQYVRVRPAHLEEREAVPA